MKTRDKTDKERALAEENPASSREIDPHTDLDIISNTYRAILDPDGFDAMVASWRIKLDRIADDTQARAHISGQLLDQLSLAQRTMEALDRPIGDDPLARAIEDVPGPALVLSPEGRIAMLNVQAASKLGARQGAFLDPARIDPRSVSDFKALLRAAGSRSNRAQAILRLLPPDDAEPIVCEAYFLNRPEQEKAFVVIRSLEIEWSEQASDLLSQAFDLSSAELDVARLFFLTRSVEEIARQRDVSLLTARTQIKSIMAKTEVPSQADLMRLLAMIASRAIRERKGESAHWRDPLGREESLALADGRVIAWTWMGAQDGRPVVLCRGFPMCYLLPPTYEERLRDAGLKLYALSRPGYGNSSLHPGLSPLEDNLACLRAFLDRVIGQPCVGIGLSNGFLPLLAEAAANPSRFSALIAIGYTGVLDRSGVKRLQPIQQAMMRLIGIMPWLVDLMARQAHRMIEQHGVDWYLERAYRTRPHDIATYADPDLTPFIRNACAHLLAQGHTAFVRDLELARAPIDNSIEALDIPLHWLAPTEDGVFDHAKFSAVELRNPRIRFEPVSEAGELVLYQQTEAVVDRIIAITRHNGHVQ